MATDITTPASLTYTGGTIRDTRPAPARLRYTASTTLVSSKDTPTTTAAEIPELDRLTSFEKILNKDGTPTPRFMGFLQEFAEKIEESFEAVNARVDEVAILARLSAVETLAETASDKAETAQTTADAVKTATQNTFNDIDPTYSSGFAERLEP